MRIGNLALLALVALFSSAAQAQVTETSGEGSLSTLPAAINVPVTADSLHPYGDFANSHHYQAHVRSPNLEDLQEYRNCIQYEFCQVDTEKFSKDGDDYVLDVTSPMDETHFKKVLKDCPLVNFKAKVTFTNESGAPVPYVQDNFADYSNYYGDRVIQYLNANATANLRSNMDVLNDMIHTSQFDPVLQKVTDLSQMDLMGYKLFYDPAFTFGGAITDHETQQIKFGPTTFQGLEACQLIRIARHETEHVHQNAYQEACAASGNRSELAEHDQRELSAHLNDALNVTKYCPNERWAKRHVKFLTDTAKRYIRQLGMGDLQ